MTDDDQSEYASRPLAAPRRSRAKYAPKACIACRHRKLKCSGTAPCARCSRSRRECCYAEDHAAAQVLWNLTDTNHNNSADTANLDTSKKQTKNNGENSAVSVLQDRVTRLEELVAKLSSTVLGPDPVDVEGQASIEPSERGEALPNNFQGDTAFEKPLDALNANLPTVMLELGIERRSNQNSEQSNVFAGEDSLIETTTATSPNNGTSSVYDALSNKSTHCVSVGARQFPFPAAEDYERYLSFFFEEVNPCHPCINEVDFRQRSKDLVSSIHAPGTPRRSISMNISFIALNYVIFACTDILSNMSPVPASGFERKGPCPGWQWFLAGDELIGRKKASGDGGLEMIQYLIFEAFFLIHADKPNAAYNATGLACRMCFQFGLHRQKFWEPKCSPYSVHMRQRIFWTAYFVDKRVSLSTGRPYAMRDLDIAVDLPAYIDDKKLFPGQPLPPQDLNRSFLMYLTGVTAFSKLGAEILDNVFSASAADRQQEDSGYKFRETIFVLDAKIKHWIDNVLPHIPILSSNGPCYELQVRQLLLVRTRMLHLRLLLYRRDLLSQHYSAETARESATVANQIIASLQTRTDELHRPSSFRFYVATTLGASLLVLAALLVRRPLSTTGLDESHIRSSISHFHSGVEILRSLAENLQAARRILADLKDIIEVVTVSLTQQNALANETGSNPDQNFESSDWMSEDLYGLLPYGSMDFTLQSGIPDEMSQSPAQSNNDYQMGNPALNYLDSWDWGTQSGTTGNGAPWI